MSNYIQYCRETLTTYGAEATELPALFSVLLDIDESKAWRLAHRYRELTYITDEQLQSEFKLTPIKIAKLRASLEISRRVVPHKEGFIFRSPSDIYQFFKDSLQHKMQECFLVLFLDTKNHLVGWKTVFVGTLNNSIVHPREIFREAILRSANSIVCIHNHPSGSPAASLEDWDVTKRLRQAGMLMGVELLDHLIIAEKGFYSCREQKERWDAAE